MVTRYSKMMHFLLVHCRVELIHCCYQMKFW